MGRRTAVAFVAKAASQPSRSVRPTSSVGSPRSRAGGAVSCRAGRLPGPDDPAFAHQADVPGAAFQHLPGASGEQHVVVALPPGTATEPEGGSQGDRFHLGQVTAVDRGPHPQGPGVRLRGRPCGDQDPRTGVRVDGGQVQRRVEHGDADDPAAASRDGPAGQGAHAVRVECRVEEEPAVADQTLQVEAEAPDSAVLHQQGGEVAVVGQGQGRERVFARGPAVEFDHGVALSCLPGPARRPARCRGCRVGRVGAGRGCPVCGATVPPPRTPGTVRLT